MTISAQLPLFPTILMLKDRNCLIHLNDQDTVGLEQAQLTFAIRKCTEWSLLCKVLVYAFRNLSSVWNFSQFTEGKKRSKKLSRMNPKKCVIYFQGQIHSVILFSFIHSNMFLSAYLDRWIDQINHFGPLKICCLQLIHSCPCPL